MTVPLPLGLTSPDLTPQRLAAFGKILRSPDQPPPFSGADVTVGVENEFQVVVEGSAQDVDLAVAITESTSYRNLKKRAGRGDLNPRLLAELDTFLDDRIWENSWVRFPRRLLGDYSAMVLARDLRADKEDPASPPRGDQATFLFTRAGEPWLRVPVSYLLKLSLAEALGQGAGSDPLLRPMGERLMAHLISDNSSPEVISFTVVHGENGALPGRSAAHETSRRFFFLHLLIDFAHHAFELTRHGQRCHLYLAPNPPARQKRLNDLISDQFYRELFLNPCLSGWRFGETKKAYMGLCHRTLSRSQLNTIAKLKEAGIITNNLVVLPNTSSTSLANNGTHITLGSRRLSHGLRGPEGDRCEKHWGDLAIKIIEHFLPLFVTTCSAAPHRLAFSDFHPETVLGYLPHELDYTHLRMLWRRWKKKADLRFCGHSVTPMGPLWLDRLTSTMLRLRGDFVPDVRLIDYLVALHSVEQSPGLDGTPGNQEQLKRDLTEMGVFDSRMAIYLPYRMRALAQYGFSGFEGRHYSLFPDLAETFALAVDLQTLITRIAYGWILDGSLGHADIPDDPCTESERRQIFFAAAIGVPTVFIHGRSKNTLLRRILALVQGQRASRRYRGYVRIEVAAYQRACLEVLRQTVATGLPDPEAATVLATLEAIMQGTRPTAAARLTDAILARHGRTGDPLRLPAADFNRAAETYYRTDLCRLHLQNGLDSLIADGRRLDAARDPAIVAARERLLGSAPATLFIREAGQRLLAGCASPREGHLLLLLTLLIVHLEAQAGPQIPEETPHATPVHCP